MTQEQSEHLRWAVLQYLAERQRIAFSAVQILRGIAVHRLVDFAVSSTEIADAAALLAGKGLVAGEKEPLGATEYLRATSDGVVAWERRRAELSP